MRRRRALFRRFIPRRHCVARKFHQRTRKFNLRTHTHTHIHALLEAGEEEKFGPTRRRGEPPSPSRASGRP